MTARQPSEGVSGLGDWPPAPAGSIRASRRTRARAPRRGRLAPRSIGLDCRHGDQGAPRLAGLEPSLHPFQPLLTGAAALGEGKALKARQADEVPAVSTKAI